MSLFSNIQKQYEQLWKHVVRPTRLPYNQQKLGPVVFRYQGIEAQRKDFCLTNSRGLQFSCSLWIPVKVERANCLVYMHGNSSNRLEGMEYLGKLIVQGIALCTFDFTGSGNADGQYVSLGYYEQQDLKMVLQELKVYPRIDKLALWGRSMGAVTALLYLPQDNSISSVVLDSPFKSLKGLIEDMALKTSSKVPGIILSAVFKMVEGTIKEKAKFSIYSLNPLKHSAPKIFIPAFFIVGVQDDIIPIQHTGELFEAYGSDDKTIKMINGDHNSNRPSIVIDEVIQFLKERFQEEKNMEKELSSTEATKQDTEKETENNIPEVKQEELVEVEKAIKTGKFAWSNLFSAFSSSEPIEQTSKEEEKPLIQQKKEQPKPQEVKAPKPKPKIKKQKQKLKPKDTSKYQISLEDKVRQYSHGYF